MPRLEADAVWVARGVGKRETETRGVPTQPTILGRARECAVEVQIRRRCEIDRAARVVFAATRCGDEAQDFVDGFARGKLAANHARLSRDAAITGEEQQRVTISRRGNTQPTPRGGGGGG